MTILSLGVACSDFKSSLLTHCFRNIKTGLCIASPCQLSLKSAIKLDEKGLYSNDDAVILTATTGFQGVFAVLKAILEACHINSCIQN